jgi:putative hydrolase of HD superfamily
MEKLKRIQRKGWLRAGVREPESVADHSYACAVLSMIAADLCGLDTERLIRMALLHDLGESVTGDLTPRQKKNLGAQFRTFEKRATINAVARLPFRMRKEYHRLMEDYQKQRSEESRVLRDIDRIEMGLQALAYIREGYSSKNMAEFLKSAEKDLSTDIGRSLLEAVKSENRV